MSQAVFDKIVVIEEEIDKILSNGHHNNIGLCSGNAGMVLFYYELYRLTGQ